MPQTAIVALSKGRHKGWESVHLSREPLELVLVPQVGGRIMGMLWRGHNLSFTQPEREGQIEDLSNLTDLGVKKRAMGFPLWGGDKTWVAPQTCWTEGVPFLDLDSGPYDLVIEKEGPDVVIVRMTSRRCRETGVEITRIVNVPVGTNQWSVTHRIRNRSTHDVQWGIWDVHMILRPGRVYLPRNPASAFPRGIKTFAEEGESTAVRGKVVSEQGSLVVLTCEGAQAFKFGVDATEGWMLAVLEVDGRLVGYRRESPSISRRDLRTRLRY